MTSSASLEEVACPYCGSEDRDSFATERGFFAVRCSRCRFIYVSPRPSLGAIDQAVRSGAHGDESDGLQVSARRVSSKVGRYSEVLARLFADVWSGGKPVTWLDIGAGYGELVEAVNRLAPPGSVVEGLEPMRPKAEAARRRGLRIVEDYLRPTRPKVDVVSFIDVFSHIPDFRAFLADVRQVLKPGGELFMETGNLADVEARSEFADELGLPDHLGFAGERHLRGYLEEAGFEVLIIERQRVDGAVQFAKVVVKKLLGRPACLRLPYTSRYRQLLIRARLRVE